MNWHIGLYTEHLSEELMVQTKHASKSENQQNSFLTVGTVLLQRRGQYTSAPQRGKGLLMEWPVKP